MDNWLKLVLALGAVAILFTLIHIVGVNSQPTVKWAGDWNRECNLAHTNESIEYGFRSDGVMMWRKQ
jgi:hypothetical protein